MIVYNLTSVIFKFVELLFFVFAHFYKYVVVKFFWCETHDDITAFHTRKISFNCFY